jgi:hypothetical protein
MAHCSPVRSVATCSWNGAKHQCLRWLVLASERDSTAREECRALFEHLVWAVEIGEMPTAAQDNQTGIR